MNFPSASETVSYMDVEKRTDQLIDAVNIYERFEDEELYNQEKLPSEIEGYIRELDRESLEEGLSPGIILANEIKDMFFQLDETVNKYTQQNASNTDQNDWNELLEETSDARTALRRAQQAGYERSWEGTDNQERYTVPEEMSLARLIHNDADVDMPEAIFYS